MRKTPLIALALAFTVSACGENQEINYQDQEKVMPPSPETALPTAVLDGDLWRRDSKVYEVLTAGGGHDNQACVIVENYEGIDLACFASAAHAVPQYASEILQPLRKLDGDLWKKDSATYVYRPRSNNNVSCVIAENHESIEIECKPSGP